MLWVNTGVQARQIPVHSYDIVAAVVLLQTYKVLVISAYDPRIAEGTARAREEELNRKIDLVSQTIDKAQSEEG